MRRSGFLVSFAAITLTAGCGPMNFHSSDVIGAPDNPGVPTQPNDPPPTGSKWQGVEIDGACGRTGVTWVLVDEVCGQTSDPAYLDAFRAPMFRDGALFGSTLYAVDATFVWAIDVTDPASPKRVAMVSGLGEPLAVGAHGTNLVIASGAEGLVLLDVQAPQKPAQGPKIALPGPALDVFVDGDVAYVAMGAAGVAAVDLAASPPAITKVLPVPGFVAGVAVKDGLAYVAACDTLVVLDVASGLVRSKAWLADAVQEKLLVAPAKDVTLAGDVAFVAAGRFGAVAVNIKDPNNAQVLGNCTLPHAPDFYASGVRVTGDALYIAGGEWGVLRVDITDPLSACAQPVAPDLQLPSSGGGVCSANPPWKVLPWEQLWSVPPPGRDPIQTLPTAATLYTFGDARRIGLRAVEMRDPADVAKSQGRFDEPRWVTGVDARAGRVLVLGPRGGLFARDDATLLAPLPNGPNLGAAVAGALLGDGRWVIATDQQELILENGALTHVVPNRVWERGITTVGARVIVPVDQGVFVVDADKHTESLIPGKSVANMPQAIAANASFIYRASPEWLAGEQLDGAAVTALDPEPVFGADDILDPGRWLEGLPRRLLVTSDAGLVEIASLAGNAGLLVHAPGAPKLTLPPGTYVQAAAAGKVAYVLSADRSTYRSQILTIALDPPAVVAIESFAGVGTGLALDGDRLYVADADKGVRVYKPSATGLTTLGLFDKGGAP